MTTVYNDDACIRSLGSGAGEGNSEPPVVLTYTETHQLILEDLDVSGNVVEVSSSEAVEVIVPLDATLLFTPANQAMFVAGGTGDVTFVGETPDVVINSKEGMLTLNGQYAGARLYKRNEPNQWGLVGDLKSGVHPFRMLAPDAATSSFTIAVEMLSGDATIDWGDGSPPQTQASSVYDPNTIIMSGAASHDYSSFVGAAEIKVTGDVGRIQVYGSGITEVVEYGNFNHYMLLSPSLTTVPSVLPSSVTSMEFMFSFTPLFNQALTYDTVNVTNMRGAFQGSGYNQPVPFNTINVTTMYAMFANNTAFNQPINFDFSSCLDIKVILSNCTSYNQPINWIAPLADSLTGIVSGCTNFNSSINITANSALDADVLLLGLTSFNQPVTLNMAAATSFFQIFKNCTALDSLITINAPNAVNYAEGFRGCTSLNTAPVITMDSATSAGLDSFLRGATSFDQDLSGYCVTNVLSEPTNFSTDGCPITEPHKPVWGTCPV